MVANTSSRLASAVQVAVREGEHDPLAQAAQARGEAFGVARERRAHLGALPGQACARLELAHEGGPRRGHALGVTGQALGALEGRSERHGGGDFHHGDATIAHNIASPEESHQGHTAHRATPGDGRRGDTPRSLRRAGALAALRRAAPRRPLPRHHRLVHRARLGHGGEGARAARRLGRACAPASPSRASSSPIAAAIRSSRSTAPTSRSRGGRSSACACASTTWSSSARNLELRRGDRRAHLPRRQAAQPPRRADDDGAFSAVAPRPAAPRDPRRDARLARRDDRRARGAPHAGRDRDAQAPRPPPCALSALPPRKPRRPHRRARRHDDRARRHRAGVPSGGSSPRASTRTWAACARTCRCPTRCARRGQPARVGDLRGRRACAR